MLKSLEQKVEEAKNAYLNRCHRSFRRWRVIQIILIALGALATITAAIQVEFQWLRYVVVVITTVSTALHAYITTFRMQDIMLVDSRISEDLAIILEDVRYKKGQNLTEDEARKYKYEIKKRMRNLMGNHSTFYYNAMFKSSGGINNSTHSHDDSSGEK